MRAAAAARPPGAWPQQRLQPLGCPLAPVACPRLCAHDRARVQHAHDRALSGRLPGQERGPAKDRAALDLPVRRAQHVAGSAARRQDRRPLAQADGLPDVGHSGHYSGPDRHALAARSAAGDHSGQFVVHGADGRAHGPWHGDAYRLRAAALSRQLHDHQLVRAAGGGRAGGHRRRTHPRRHEGLGGPDPI